ncbi:prepilin-type N-terminal cleavage/methylation domain-containing protein [Bremerella sp. P1]|uniref:prepilin-type N-terminal cleavage/methylation domain-containing protein n=1 Tax=Bremerella sp. P1 TaxID=3026424 RepID=UPI0023674C00|nr:prepilin-type N-terminal cleavage/methylation domain-containing protein [Bremerella sp. P1]WDI41225.1 prepilin-type N-terminal cleavage/methylation domain-containing protein [Bremerella sp. P1]
MTYLDAFQNGRTGSKSRSLASRHQGFSLLELLAVVTILGLLAAIGATRLAPGIQGNVARGTDSFRTLMALRQARASAIATGDNHRLRMLSTSGAITGFQIERLGSSTTIVEGPHIYSGETIILQTGSDATFNFHGEATVSPVMTFAGPDRTNRITVVAATGWGLLEEL